MKTKTFHQILLSITFFFTFSLISFAQTLVTPLNNNTEYISSFLKKNNFEVSSITKDYLKINKIGKTRSIYLDMKENNRYIFFNLAYKVVAGTSKEKIDAFLKKANDLKMIKTRYFETGNNIQIEYYFWTQQGYTQESLIDAVDEFLLYIGDCVKADTEKILI